MNPSVIIGLVATVVFLLLVFPLYLSLPFIVIIILVAIIPESFYIDCDGPGVILPRVTLVPLSLFIPDVIYLAFAFDMAVMLFVRMPRIPTMTHEFVVALNTALVAPVDYLPFVTYLAIVCFVFTSIEKTPVSNAALQVFVYACGETASLMASIVMITLSLVREGKESEQ